MGRQDGSTLIEMLLAMSIFALMTGMAMYSAFGFVNSSRLSQVAAKLADNVALSRYTAVERYEQWRIRFTSPVGAGDVFTGYVLESCALDPGTSICTASWVTQKEANIETGMGVVPKEGVVTSSVLTFDRTGLFLNNTTDIQVCTLSNGACQSGSLARVVRVRGFSGIIET